MHETGWPEVLAVLLQNFLTDFCWGHDKVDNV